MDYDAFPITGHMKYTYSDYRDYYIFSLFRGKRYRLGERLFFIGYPVLILFITAMLLLFGYDLFLIICDALLILIFTVFLLSIHFSPKKYYLQHVKMVSGGIDFEFRNNEFRVEQCNDLYVGKSSIKYEAFFKVYETKTMFYIFIAPRQAFLISKDSLTNDSPELLREFLKNRLGSKKFVTCR